MESVPQEIELYLLPNGSCPFSQWLEGLKDRKARAKIKKSIDRVALGNFGDVKAIGNGISELRINYGPGYRIYFARTGQRIILLLCGGDKKTQNKDILRAQQYWIAFQKSAKKSDDANS